MIKRIQVIGLRGKSFDLELGPINLVIGQNKAGKTTIADAIRWGLLGYIPGMPAPPRGWAELIGNGTTEASIQLEDTSSSALWRAVRLEKGSVKMYASVEQPTSEINLLTLDPGQFFAQTGPRRAQIVAEASAESFDWKELVPENLRSNLYATSKWPVWIGEEIETAKSQRSAWADKKKMLAQTLRGLESVREIVIEDDAAKKAALTAAQEQIGGLKEQLRAVIKQIEKVKQPATNGAQNQLDAIRRALQEFLGRTHDEDSYADRLKDVQMKLDELDKSDSADQRTLAKFRSDVVKLGNDLAIEDSRIQQLEAGFKTIETKYAKLKKGKCCPTCGAAGKIFAEALKTAQAAEMGTQEMHLDLARTKHESVAVEYERVCKRVSDAEEYLDKRAELELALAELKDEAKLIELWKEHDRLVAEAKTEAGQYDIQGLQERQYEIECEIEDVGEDAGMLEHKLAEITYSRSQKRQLADIETQLEATEAGWKTANTAVNELEVLRERFTAMSLEPVLDRLKLFTRDIFNEPVTLDETELGRMVGARWVPLTQFSGSEQAVAVAGLTCALQPGHSIVLADELSSFDDEHLAKFLRNVTQAYKAGVINQFIGFSTPRKSLQRAVPQSVEVKMI